MPDLSLVKEETDRRIETLGNQIQAYTREAAGLRDQLGGKERDLATLQERLVQFKEVQAWLASQGS